MTNTQRFIELAVDGGWQNFKAIGYGDTKCSDCSVSDIKSISYIFLDPLAWQAVGKSLGWTRKEKLCVCGVSKVSGTGFCCAKCGSYEYRLIDKSSHDVMMHRFIDLLISGKSIDQALGEIIVDK